MNRAQGINPFLGCSPHPGLKNTGLPRLLASLPSALESLAGRGRVGSCPKKWQALRNLKTSVFPAYSSLFFFPSRS